MRTSSWGTGFGRRRGGALGVASVVWLLASGLVGVAVVVATAGPAAAAPSFVSEFQPTTTATNPNAPADGGKWGGRTVAMTTSPANSNVVIAASESGGLFRSTDGGSNWTHTDGLLPFRMVDVAFAPTNANVVLATTFKNGDTQAPGGVWRSTDGGVTWSQPATTVNLCGANTPYTAWGLAFEPSSSTTYAGTDCGLAFSSDLGATWTLQSMVRVGSVVAQPGGTVDACADSGHFRFTKSGNTLTQVTGPDLIAGLGCSQNITGGNTLQLVFPHVMSGEPQETNVLFAEIFQVSTTQCTSMGAAVYVTQLYESDDSGVTWNPLAIACQSRGPWVQTHLSRDGVANHFDIFYSGGLDIYRFTCTSGGPGTRCAGAPGQPTGPNVTLPHADPSGVEFATDATNCARFAIADGGVASSADCGATFTQLAGSGANGGYNALQLYEVTGQIHPDHTDLYFGTQDNDVWASPDGGATWPIAICCEGFFFQTPNSTANHTGQIITSVICSGCNNSVEAAHFDGCSYNPCAGSGWTNPPGSNPGNPFLVDDRLYLATSQSSPPNTQLNLGTVTGTWPALTVTWATVNSAPATPLSITQTLVGRPFLAGPASNPTVYWAYCQSNCGLPNQVVGLLKITGIRSTNAAAVTTVDTGLTGIAGYCNGQGTFVCPVVWGVDPKDPNHLIVEDTSGSTIVMRQTRDGGATWPIDTALTNAVLGGGRYLGIDPNSGSQAHTIGFDPVSNRIVVGTESAGVVASLDNGVTWETLPGSTAATAVSSFFYGDPTRDTVLVSTYGRGLWKLALPAAKSNTTTTLTSVPNPSTFGQSVTFTATVTPNPPPGPMGTPPTGTVAFVLNGKTVATVALDGLNPGHATFTTAGLLPGNNVMVAKYSGDGLYNPSQSSPYTQVVSCANNITGNQGSLTLGPGSSWCLNRVNSTGSVTVQPGAAVAVISSSVATNITSNGATALALCSVRVVNGPLTVQNSTGWVVVGDTDALSCGSDSVLGAATFTSNSGGVEVNGGSFGGLTMTNTTGAGAFPEDTAPEIQHNRISGNLACSGNVPTPSNDGQPNSVTGTRSGQCGTPGF